MHTRRPHTVISDTTVTKGDEEQRGRTGTANTHTRAAVDQRSNATASHTGSAHTSLDGANNEQMQQTEGEIATRNAQRASGQAPRWYSTPQRTFAHTRVPQRRASCTTPSGPRAISSPKSRSSSGNTTSADDASIDDVTEPPWSSLSTLAVRRHITVTLASRWCADAA
jgi:hypothetical protein